jgi:hypothetical protein
MAELQTLLVKVDASEAKAIIERWMADIGMSEVLLEVGAERQRQITAKGFTPRHDDLHDEAEMASAAAALAVGDSFLWPWDDGWNPGERRDDLICAAALLVAEIERLDRLSASGKVEGEP